MQAQHGIAEPGRGVHSGQSGCSGLCADGPQQVVRGRHCEPAVLFRCLASVCMASQAALPQQFGTASRSSLPNHKLWQPSCKMLACLNWLTLLDLSQDCVTAHAANDDWERVFVLHAARQISRRRHCEPVALTDRMNDADVCHHDDESPCSSMLCCLKPLAGHLAAAHPVTAVASPSKHGTTLSDVTDLIQLSHDCSITYCVSRGVACAACSRGGTGHSCRCP